MIQMDRKYSWDMDLVDILAFLLIYLQVWMLQGIPEYNAFERDIAVLNVFFGDSTVLGTFGRGEVKHAFYHALGGEGGSVRPHKKLR